MEMGHIFQLGTRYAEALGLQVLDAGGKLVTPTMGSYGIGVSRAVAAVAENTSDEVGLCWPRELAPYDLHLVAAGKTATILTAATDLATRLDDRGVSVLVDDRDVTPGVKFADAELLGMPTIVVVGRGLANGIIEVRDRRTGERVDVAADSAAEHVLATVRPD
jgi:prolyl-tRNA synthetase